MPALQTNSNTNLLTVAYNQSFSHPQLKQLIFKPEALLHTVRKATRKVPVQRAEFSSMGMVMSFQPSLWDDKNVEEAWNESMKMIQTRMKRKYAAECINKLMARLNKMYFTNG